MIEGVESCSAEFIILQLLEDATEVEGYKQSFVDSILKGMDGYRKERGMYL